MELVIIQAKNKASFEEIVPTKFKDFVDNCLRLNADITADAQKTLYSEALLTLVKQFHDIYRQSLTTHSRLSVTFFHSSLSDHVDKKVETRADITVTRVQDIFPTAECKYEFLKGSTLLKLYNQQPERCLPLPIQKYFDYKSFERNAYVGVVKLPDFYKFISQDGLLREYMFEANVRAHEGDVKVNKAIRATLTNPANDDFWWLNNGITVIASDVSYADGSLQITDPMIVNGLQTSYELFEHFSSGGSTGDGRTIMARVISNTNTDTSDRIITATNSQTKIASINLHATEDIQRNIEMALKADGLFYDRRKNFYRNKGESAEKIITIGYMAQAVAAIVLQQPDQARARPTTVADKNYNKMFSEQSPIGLYSKCAQIMKRVDSYVDRKTADQATKLNLVFYVAMYATCTVLKSARPKRNRIAAIDISQFTDTLLQLCYQWVLTEYRKLGGDDKVAKGSVLVANLRDKILREHAKPRKTGR